MRPRCAAVGLGLEPRGGGGGGGGGGGTYGIGPSDDANTVCVRVARRRRSAMRQWHLTPIDRELHNSCQLPCCTVLILSALRKKGRSILVVFLVSFLGFFYFFQ